MCLLIKRNVIYILWCWKENWKDSTCKSTKHNSFSSQWVIVTYKAHTFAHTHKVWEKERERRSEHTSQARVCTHTCRHAHARVLREDRLSTAVSQLRSAVSGYADLPATVCWSNESSQRCHHSKHGWKRKLEASKIVFFPWATLICWWFWGCCCSAAGKYLHFKTWLLLMFSFMCMKGRKCFCLSTDVAKVSENNMSEETNSACINKEDIHQPQWQLDRHR